MILEKEKTKPTPNHNIQKKKISKLSWLSDSQVGACSWLSGGPGRGRECLPVTRTEGKVRSKACLS